MNPLTVQGRVGARPPVELRPILRSMESQRIGPAEWLPAPAFPGDCARQRAVELDRTIERLIGDRRLEGTLRTVDLLNGCCNQCDTCLADAPRPSRLISFASIERLFADARFLAMLQPDSLRFGSCGDLLDHPQGIAIAQLALRATEALDARRLGQEGRRHTVKIFTNFRPAKRASLDALLELARKNEERLTIVVSLPLNRSDAINRSFIKYAAARPRYFKLSGLHADGYPVIQGSIKFGRTRVQVWDVRHPEWLLNIGRVLPRSVITGVVPPGRLQRRLRALELGQRGLCKTYLNSDGLWLMVYTTQYESHTSRIYTPITSANLGYLSAIPYHPDFPAPPHWPGGAGKLKALSEDEALLDAEARRRGDLRGQKRRAVHSAGSVCHDR